MGVGRRVARVGVVGAAGAYRAWAVLCTFLGQRLVSRRVRLGGLDARARA